MPMRRITDFFRHDTRASHDTTVEVDFQPGNSTSHGVEEPMVIPLTSGENLGLKVVHNLNRESILLDIVFVHGLTGNAFSTWQHPTVEVTRGRGVHWPSDLVKADIPNARVSLFGYDANVASFWGGASQNRLSGHAETLVGDLTGLREDTSTENRHIIFITHSLGGLVVKRALQISEANAENHLRRFEKHTAGIVFLGTPHGGSDLASFAKSVGKCLRLVGKRVNTDILDTLRRDSQVLLDIEDWFGHWRRRRNEDHKALQITCFYEELELPVIGKVVEEHQAKIMGYSSYGIHANHMNMTKFSSAEDNGYKTIRREIRRWMKIIGEQRVQYKTPEQERREARFLSQLYTCPYEDRKNINDERIPGTCEWFTNHDLFRQWNEDDQSALLWVSADPGSGKSVLAKYLIDHVLPLPGVTICYFFFKDGFPDQQSVLHAIRSLLHQICSNNYDLVNSLLLQRSEYEAGAIFESFDRLWNIFIDIAQNKRAGEIICVIDALDECRQDGFLQLSAKISSLFLDPPNDRARLKFLLTSRPYEHIRWEFQELEDLIPTIHLAGEDETEVRKISKEIDLVVQSRLRSIGIKRRLTGAERLHMSSLMATIPNRTYLWICLTLDVIEKLRGFSRGNVIESIKNLPRTVDEAYEKILQRSPDPLKAWKALHLIVAATRPLSIAELSIAMALNESDNSIDFILDNLEPADRFAETLRNLCGLFVVIIDQKIYFLHQTAREFLVQRAQPVLPLHSNMVPPTSWKQSIYPAVAASFIAQACIWYLTSNIPRLERRMTPMAPDFDPIAFGEYARKYWHYHFRLSNILSDDKITRSALRLCQKFDFDQYSDNPGSDLASEDPLAKAAYIGLHQVVQLLVETSYKDVDAQREDCRTPLSWAAERGFLKIVEFLVSRDQAAVDDRDPQHPNMTPLHHAAAGGHTEVVQCLLQTKKVNVNSMPNESGYPDVWNSATQLDIGDAWTETALGLAAMNGHGAVIRLLLQQSDIDVDAKNCYGETALMRAETRGHDDIVALLLMTERVDVNAVDRYGLSIIERATVRAQENIVRLLLQTGQVDVTYQKAAFFVAISLGNGAMVETLLTLGGLDINILDDDGQTALMRAATRGDESIVKIILRCSGIDVNVKSQGIGDDWGPSRRDDTALICAARFGHKHIVQLLLHAGANLSAQNIDGDTALTSAAAYLHPKTVKALLRSNQATANDVRRALSQVRVELARLKEEISHGLTEMEGAEAKAVQVIIAMGSFLQNQRGFHVDNFP
ncbi:hypothetical protein BKA66DRAFT_454343 [Pyrenochaeta sp. MPI-SDFR-AT-0127]|nr:hypothetical protein BKA66DRAFT_454343 [Pyrenochaeta sp. MPI-SDFR-AT-0127]